MAGTMKALLAIGGVLGAGGILASNASNKTKGAITDIESTIADLEADRIKPFDPSTLVSDLSAQLSNPYANLGVATQAAEIKMQETDKALANTLDTLRATGAGAAGATALANAAIKGKQAVTASIEQQEVNNEKLRAQGEMQLQQARLAEQARVQGAQVEGAKFMYEKQAELDKQQLDRQQALLDQERANQLAIQQGVVSALGGTLGALGSIL